MPLLEYSEVGLKATFFNRNAELKSQMTSFVLTGPFKNHFGNSKVPSGMGKVKVKVNLKPLHFILFQNFLQHLFKRQEKNFA